MTLTPSLSRVHVARMTATATAALLPPQAAMSMSMSIMLEAAAPPR